MNEKEILASANDAILEQPIKFNVKVKPKGWFHKLLVKLRIKPSVIALSIEPTVLGARVWYSKALLGVDVSEEDTNKPLVVLNHELTIEYTEKMAKAVASAIHNRNSEPPQWLIDTILDNFSANDFINVVNVLKEHINSKDFLNSIISLKGMSLNEKEEIIASTQTPGK